MSPEVIAILMFTGLLVGLFLGHPLAFVLGSLAVIFGLIGWGPECFYMFMNQIFGKMTSFVLVAIPLFIFMGNLLGSTGVAEDMFEALRYLLGPLRGGVAMALVLVSTIFAACTGIIGASVVTMGILGLAPLLSYGYQKELATGTIMAGGTLGILIAPSIMLVVMGDQAALSVGKLFAGAIFPGLILSGLYLIYIAIRCYLNPELGPGLSPEERRQVPVLSRLRMAIVSFIPPMVLILSVLGIIFFGIASPTEAAGVGAFVAFLMTLAYRRFTWKRFKDAVIATAKTTSMVCMILATASCFASVFMGMGGGKVVMDLILGLGGKWLPFAVMMFIILILGMFIDWVGIVYITFPIFLPIANKLGFDPLWFVLMIAVNLQASFLTPPFGYAIFYLRGIAPEDVTLMHIYRGIIPFVILMLIGLAVCIIFKPVTMWLPSLIG